MDIHKEMHNDLLSDNDKPKTYSVKLIEDYSIFDGALLKLKPP